MRCNDTCCRPELEVTFAVLSRTSHVARKEHRCAECGKSIEAGTRYYREAALFDGDFTVAKTHAPAGYGCT